MAFDLVLIRNELRAAPLTSPLPLELAMGIVGDLFEETGSALPALQDWKAWLGSAGPERVELLQMLGHVVASSSVRAETLRVLQPTPVPVKVVAIFLDDALPLTAEMVRSNAFRQEEFLRKWVRAVKGSIAGETAEQSEQ